MLGRGNSVLNAMTTCILLVGQGACATKSLNETNSQSIKADAIEQGRELSEGSPARDEYYLRSLERYAFSFFRGGPRWWHCDVRFENDAAIKSASVGAVALVNGQRIHVQSSANQRGDSEDGLLRIESFVGEQMPDSVDQSGAVVRNDRGILKGTSIIIEASRIDMVTSIADKIAATPYAQFVDPRGTHENAYFVYAISDGCADSVYGRRESDPGFRSDFEIIAPLFEEVSARLPEWRYSVTTVQRGIIGDQ